MDWLISYSVDRPRVVAWLMLLVSLVLIVIVALPSLWPNTFTALNPLRIDTDPENMLSQDEEVRVFHNEMKRAFSLYDMVVLGVVNESHPDGVFNKETLGRIYQLGEYAKTLSAPDPDQPGRRAGVVIGDIITPQDVDNIEQAGPGAVRFEWLMDRPPATDAEALAVREKARRIPFLDDTVISDDGAALALYIPLTSKDESYEVAGKLREMIAGFDGDERYHITGLPVSEDQFGVEMFIQMAICAPLAMLVVSLLMFYFFKRVVLVAASMGVAMVSVIVAMGLLVATGNTVHIMSSMIPIFIMPIAVLDSIHILSEFFDRHDGRRSRRETVISVMDVLFKPMLFTSLTTATGFLSLALTPIPPVQLFGLFVAIGVMTAWLVTITFIPACIMLMSPESLQGYGAVFTRKAGADASVLTRLLAWTGRQSSLHSRLIIVGVLAASLVAVYGINQIVINDNPVRWFEPDHEIRVADRVLNAHFGGTYMAYLALAAPDTDVPLDAYALALAERMVVRGNATTDVPQAAAEVYGQLQQAVLRFVGSTATKPELLQQLEQFINEQRGLRQELAGAWFDALLMLDRERQSEHVFKQPEVLAYIKQLQQYLLTTGVVGKSNSVVDIVETVNRELYSGEQKDLRIPDSPEAVAQTMLTFQSSHRPQDLWHFVTPDFRKASIWVQMKSGDNRDMSRVVAAIDRFVAGNPPPYALSQRWFGLNYINVIWQEKMVNGMLYALSGSFVVVFLMMTLLFRSVAWGLLCMVPLSVTIGLMYGVIGLIGKDYDMPIAVLSSLSLGLAVDYAVHFVTRTRMIYERAGSWPETIPLVFAEPARAITRNAVVNGVGFLPLLAAPLVPYQTVGLFIASILLMAGIATLVILPAMITALQRWLFRQAGSRLQQRRV